MKRFTRYLLLAGVILCASAMSFADTFSFSFTSSGANLKGELTATRVGTTNVFAITSGWGTETGGSGCCGGTYNVVLSDPHAYFSFDNLLYPDAPAGGTLDLLGLLVFNGFDGAGGTSFNIRGNGVGQLYSWKIIDGEGFREAGDGTFTLTPEPTSLMMFGSGLLGLGGLIRRKFMA